MTLGADTLRLQVPAQAAALEPARQAMGAHLVRGGVDARTVYRCEVVLEEVLMNIVRHGQAAHAHELIELSAQVNAHAVTLGFVDRGTAFDPTQLADPVPAASLAQAPVGGLGVLLVRRLSQAVVYRREQGCNRLEVTVARDGNAHAISG